MTRHDLPVEHEGRVVKTAEMRKTPGAILEGMHLDDTKQGGKKKTTDRRSRSRSQTWTSSLLSASIQQDSLCYTAADYALYYIRTFGEQLLERMTSKTRFTHRCRPQMTTEF